MSDPVKQHFIPRSYLKNFAIEKDNNFFLEAFNKATNKVDQFINVNNLCVKKNIYTINNEKINDKYALEKHYALNVDGIYPEIYNALIDPAITHIDPEFKTKILYACLSFYFRTPKFLNQKNENIKNIIDRSLSYADEKGYIRLELDDEIIKFHTREAEDVKQDFVKHNKSIFLYEHLQSWIDFVKYKSNSVIGVTKIDDDVNIITSDNPVNIHSNLNTKTAFNYSDFIRMPLDKKHFLEILPSKYVDTELRINRLTHKNSHALTTNDGSFENAENWVLGYPETIEQHLKNREMFVNGNPKAEEYVRVDKIKMEKMFEFLDVIKENGFSKNTSAKLKELLSLPEFNDDTNLLFYKERFIKMGIW